MEAPGNLYRIIPWPTAKEFAGDFVVGRVEFHTNVNPRVLELRGGDPDVLEAGARARWKGRTFVVTGVQRYRSDCLRVFWRMSTGPGKPAPEPAPPAGPFPDPPLAGVG